MELSQIVRLVPKTKHGTNRIHQHGEFWQVVEQANRAQVFGRFKGRNAVSLRSMNKTEGPRGEKVNDERWVHLDDDTNFTIVEI